MGHANSQVFRHHYLSQNIKVDTQSWFLGTVNREDLIKTVGLMSAKRDPRTPTELKQGIIVNQHPELVGLLEEKDQIAQALKAECRTIKAAKFLKPNEY